MTFQLSLLSFKYTILSTLANLIGNHTVCLILFYRYLFLANIAYTFLVLLPWLSLDGLYDLNFVLGIIFTLSSDWTMFTIAAGHHDYQVSPYKFEIGNNANGGS